MDNKLNVRHRVIYRHGVKNRCQWGVAFGFPNYLSAKKHLRELESMGYRAIIQDVRSTDGGPITVENAMSYVGLPVTWESGQSPEDYYEKDGWLILKGGAYDQ